MVQQRNLVTCLILSIITCGIYALYWNVCLQEDVNTLADDHKTSGVMVIVLSIVTCGIYALWWMYNQGARIDNVKTARGISSSSTGVIYLLLAFFGFGIVSYALMQNEINKLA